MKIQLKTAKNLIFSLLNSVSTSIYIGWFLAVHAFEVLVLPSLMIPTQLLAQFSLTQRFIQIWIDNADVVHYMGIARYGYGYDPESFGFFPLWPIFLTLVVTSPLFIKILSCLLTFIFILLFSSLIKIYGFSKSQKTVLITFLAYPFSFLLLAPMSEPLFLFLAALSFILIEKKKYFFASIVIALATATRMIGIVLVVFFILTLFTEGKEKLRRWWWTILISPLGLISFSAYLQITQGDFRLFYKSHNMWGRGIGLESIQKVINEMIFIITQIAGSYKPVPINFLQFAAVFFFIFLGVYSFKKLKWQVWIYCILAVAIPIMSGSLLSLPRLLMAAFPLFIPFGDFLHRRPIFYTFYIAICFMLQSYLLIRFFQFEWVA